MVQSPILYLCFVSIDTCQQIVTSSLLHIVGQAFTASEITTPSYYCLETKQCPNIQYILQKSPNTPTLYKGPSIFLHISNMTDAAKNASAPAAATGSTTPPPTPAAPSPLVIGRAFLKQYYQVLSSNPTQITRFYKNNSLISHSLVPSEPATTQTLSDVIAAHESNTGSTFVWCKPKRTKRETRLVSFVWIFQEERSMPRKLSMEVFFL